MTIIPRVTPAWPHADGPPPLAAGDVHLWLAHVDAWRDCGWDDVLSAQELDRTARYRRTIDRDRGRTGRGLLRRLLAGYLGTSPAAVAIDTDASGKPRLAGASTLAFNVSGSADLAVFAFTRGPAVGVDVEAFATEPGAVGKTPLTLRDVHAMAGRFAADEAALVHGLSAADATAAFLRLWTCKEACLKCRGTGLRTPLDEIRIECVDDARAIGRLAGDRFAIRTLAPVAGSIAAVALPGDAIPEPRCWTLAR